MNKAYLLTGGNLGDRQALLQEAAAELERCCGTIARASSVYETAPWGKRDQPAFLNQVLLLHTTLLPHELLQQTQAIEQAAGRERKEKYGPRYLDIDILLYNDAVIDTPALKLPHPQMSQRRFVLVPLTELAPHLVHPVQKVTILEMLQTCPDLLAVHKL